MINYCLGQMTTNETVLLTVNKYAILKVPTNYKQTTKYVDRLGDIV